MLAPRAGTVAERAAVRAEVEKTVAEGFGESADERLLAATLRHGSLDPAGGHERAALELNVSRATYFRKLREASDRVADLLLAARYRRGWMASTPSAPHASRPDAGPDPWAPLLEEATADGRVVAESYEGARRPVLDEIPDDLHPALRDGLDRVGIERLYRHQTAALAAAEEGPFIVTTGTASGKSLCFQLPVLDVLCADPAARALYLSPTKALAQDQARALHAFGLSGGRKGLVRPAIYDGDTRREDRVQIRRSANLFLTNPDMLHMGILPHHRKWGDVFTNLAAVVVDEAHVYRGVFGSHVANVLRRLRRIAHAYGTEPRFFLASATIANPVELAERLTGLDDVALVDEDGSPGAARRIAMWNPPVLDEALQLRRSALGEAADLVAGLMRRGSRTICFVKSRRGVEVVAKLVADQLRDTDPELADLVAPYRAGYTPAQRRELEARLQSGDLRAVVTTDALELGIDIGALDAAVCVTFPGTVASLRQMWGRAGRRGSGLAVYVAGEDALDQYFCRHPEQFLERPVESAILEHESEDIHLQHLLCAAHEGPVDPRIDAAFLGPRVRAHCEHLAGLGELVERRGAFLLRHPEDFPAARVSLRSASPHQVRVVDTSTGEMLGTVEAGRAATTVHDGAVYLHLGRSYEVADFDPEAGTALVEPFGGDWYTQPKSETETHIEKLLDRRDVHGVTLSYGIVTVTSEVLAYQRTRLPSHEVIDLQALDMAPTSMTTQALWYELGADVLGGGGPGEQIPLEVLLGSLHAMEHAQIAVLPLLAMCDRWDIGGLSTNAHPQTGGPTIFVHDGHPGGVGITRRGFHVFEALCADAYRLITECPCDQGCPSCVQSPKCGNLNEPLHKDGAAEVLARMLER